MNDSPSVSDRNGKERSSSPRRKKVRQKYAPKACVSCRRSKLKCSGHNPCQRCHDNGKRCFFSEDQTAAEALQNLSRPAHSQQPSASTLDGHSTILTPRSLVPRYRNDEQPVSDAAAKDLSMEARMARVEAMLDALLQERAMYTMPGVNADRDSSGGDMPMPMTMSDPINPALSFMDHTPQAMHPQDVIDPLLEADTANIRVGSQSFKFPAAAVYQKCIDTFFRQLQLCHPCIDERLFRARSAKTLAGVEVHAEEACFLALNYSIFAVHDAYTEIARPGSDDNLPGWHWLQLADEVIGSRQLYGSGDLSLAQFLFLKAIYYTILDQPNLAYNTIGLASRYVLQEGLNRRAGIYGTGVWKSFERVRVFWNILIADRRISLSCRRPYTIRDTDVDVERPNDLFQRDIAPNLQSALHHDKLHELNSETMFLGYMIDWSRFAGSLWDGLLTAHISQDFRADKLATFEAAIADFLDNTFAIPQTEFRSPYLQPYICLSFDNLQALARSSLAMHLKIDHDTAHECSRSADETLTHVQAYETAIRYPATCILRHHIVPSLASTLLMLCAVLVSDFPKLSLLLGTWLPPVHQTFDTIIALLHDLALEIRLARRVLKDFEGIIPVVQSMLSRSSIETQLPQNPSDWDMKDFIPSNVADLLPYGKEVPDISSPALYNGTWVNNSGDLEVDSGLSDRDQDLGRRGARSGVLWI